MAGQPNSNLFLSTRVCLVCLLIGLTGHPLRSQPPEAGHQGQEPTGRSAPVAADLANTGILDDISPNTFIYFSDTKDIPAEQLPSLPFTIKGTKKFEHFIPASMVNKKVILKFTLINSSEAIKSVFFCPGFFYDSIKLFKTSDSLSGSTGRLPGSPERIPGVLPNDPDSLGYREITLQPHEKATFFASLSFIKSSTNSVNPTLTKDSFISNGIILNHKNRTSIDIITNLFAGIMLMMIFYASSQFVQTAKPEFLYYAGYALCISSLLFLKSTLHNVTTPFNFTFESFLDNIIFSLGYIFFIVFHRKFLETRENYPDLDQYLKWGTGVLTVLTVLYILSFFFSPDFRIPNFIEDSTKIFLLVLSLIFIWKGLGYRNQVMNYIVLGNISLCLLSIISQIIISTNFKLVKGISVLNLALFYYEAGITIELLFFLFALTYKNKMEIILSIQKEEKLKLETERKELEKQVAVLAAKQDERNRISADMHDELGSGVTAIRLMSEIVKSKMKEQTLPEIEKISHSANELLNKMNTIIWTMTSSNDSVENLVAYIRAYAVEFFENTAIDCYFTMPATIPAREITGEKRRNIFLSVKEALNNVLKHSQSSVVKINVIVNDKLIIEIQDDGVGINMEKLRKFGNGLNNMKKRMASIDGDFNIENREGTRTTFHLAL
jgi:signal transduction histidine kinase